MLWDGEIHAKTGLGHDKVASNLAYCLPTGLLKSLGCFFAGDIRKTTYDSVEAYTATTICELVLEREEGSLRAF